MNTPTSQDHVIPGEAQGRGYTIAQVSETLNLSSVTVRRLIKAGTLKAQKIQGKFGLTWYIDEIPAELLDRTTLSSPPPELSYARLVDEVARLNQEVGYWKGTAEALSNQLKLLSAPKPPWYKRIWHR